MKIIDLLNKIANGEEVPKKIKYKNSIYTIREDKDDYVNNCNWFTDSYDYLELNDEVEIIEEDKKIENIYHCCMSTENEETKVLIQNINDLADKINEIIDYLDKEK